MSIPTFSKASLIFNSIFNFLASPFFSIVDHNFEYIASNIAGTPSITVGLVSFIFCAMYLNPSHIVIEAPLYRGIKNPVVHS